MFLSKKFLLLSSVFFIAISACSKAGIEIQPVNNSDVNWKNGVWIQKDGRSGFFINQTPDVGSFSVGEKLKFAKSGERNITEVVVVPPFINVYVDKPLDPEGDGYPNKINR
jgi:hypothetical protein